MVRILFSASNLKTILTMPTALYPIGLILAYDCYERPRFCIFLSFIILHVNFRLIRNLFTYESYFILMICIEYLSTVG